MIRQRPILLAQNRLCSTHNVNHLACHPDEKVGVALNVRDGVYPINGLRLRPEASVTGWYFWAGGELDTAEDFFKPLHYAHLAEWCPDILKYLGLPAGWRFLFAPDHEDVWFDPELLEADDGTDATLS